MGNQGFFLSSNIFNSYTFFLSLLSVLPHNPIIFQILQKRNSYLPITLITKIYTILLHFTTPYLNLHHNISYHILLPFISHFLFLIIYLLSSVFNFLFFIFLFYLLVLIFWPLSSGLYLLALIFWFLSFDLFYLLALIFWP